MAVHLRTARLALIVLGAVLVGACAVDNDNGEDQITSTTVAEDVHDAGVSTATTLAPIGEPVDMFDLEVGACFNRYRSIALTTLVPCVEPHDGEVFHAEEHPAPRGAPYPGGREMEQDAISMCYRVFESFVGTLYEVSKLEIGVITPSQEDFEDARLQSRSIGCYLSDGRGEQLAGTMRGARV